jgi:anthranilate phosphoribosyltransferase
MKHVGPTRVELGTRTIFNLLGPLSNPAGVRRQITGVFSKGWLEPLAQVLKNLGSERVWVAHGTGGLDEITAAGVTWIAELKDGQVRCFELTPEEAGVPRGKLDDLRGGEAPQNAKALREVLEGSENGFRNAVLMTAGAALLVAGKAPTIKVGAKLAAESIASGRARAVLDRLVAVSNAP